MKDEQINLIQTSFAEVAVQQDAAATIFYNRLFALKPALRLIFLADLTEQKKKLMAALALAVGSLRQPEKLMPVLENLGRRHALYGVRDEHYDTVGAALLLALEEMLGADFDASAHAAWAEMHAAIAATMKRAAGELAAESHSINEVHSETAKNIQIQENIGIQKENNIMSNLSTRIPQAASVIAAILFFAVSALAQTTQFTYQGRLTDNQTAANSEYQMKFALYDVPGNGNQIGQTIENQAVAAANGIFTVQLDFGVNAFPGADRYLEISVRRNAVEQYVTLASRWRDASAPYAVKSLNAETAATATNSTQLGGTPSNQFVQTSDARLTDSRDPKPGGGNYIQNQNGAERRKMKRLILFAIVLTLMMFVGAALETAKAQVAADGAFVLEKP